MYAGTVQVRGQAQRRGDRGIQPAEQGPPRSRQVLQVHNS